MNDLHGLFDFPNALGTCFLPYGGYGSNYAVRESDNRYVNAARSKGAKSFKQKKKRRKNAKKSRKINRRRTE